MEAAPITPQEASACFVDSLSPTGTASYVQLIQTIVEELGLTLAYAIDAKTTSELRSMQGVLDEDSYHEFMLSQFAKHGIDKDLEKLEMDLHKAVAKLFQKHKANITSLPMRKVSPESV